MMKEALKTLELSYKFLDETCDCFKKGTVGIEMVMAMCQDIAKQQSLVVRLTNEKNKEKGIISEIPE